MRIPFIFLLSSLFFLVACQKEEKISIIQGFAQGTTYTIKYVDNGKISPKELKKLVDQELARIDKLISNYRDDSDIELFNQNKTAKQPILIDAEITDLLKISEEVYQKSEHCYDPTIKPLFSAWGFMSDKFSRPSDAELNNILKTIGFDQVKLGRGQIIKLNKDVTVDLSAIGQGYSINTVSEIFKKYNIENYIIEVGGEMVVHGKKSEGKPWKIAVERPVPGSENFSNVITKKGDDSLAIMTSGTYRHFFDEDGKRFSHILNPRTGKPVTHQTVSTTVLLPNPTYADAWSTALLCLGDKEGLKVANKYDIPVIFINIDDNNKLVEQKSDAVNNPKQWEIK